MKVVPKKPNARSQRLPEVMIIIVIAAVVVGFVVKSILGGSPATYRTTNMVEIAGYLRNARADSMRRAAKDPSQMAQVKIFNRRLYSIAIDGDGDGNVDIPLVKSLPEQSGLSINGPFPKNYIFDWQGQTVDSQNRRVTPQPLSVADPSGVSAITFAEDGTIVVLPSAKLTASN